MQLIEQARDHGLFVRRCAADHIVVVDRELRASFLLTRERVVEAWPADESTVLDSSHAEPLLALAPDVVILGTGMRQRFPPADFRAHFLTRRIGIEVMDNAAAARTFNVLASEGRNVAAAFLLGTYQR